MEQRGLNASKPRHGAHCANGEEGSILGKIHIHGGRHDTIIPRIGPVTPVEGSTAPDIVDHALEEANLPPARRVRRRRAVMRWETRSMARETGPMPAREGSRPVLCIRRPRGSCAAGVGVQRCRQREAVSGYLRPGRHVSFYFSGREDRSSGPRRGAGEEAGPGESISEQDGKLRGEKATTSRVSCPWTCKPIDRAIALLSGWIRFK